MTDRSPPSKPAAHRPQKGSLTQWGAQIVAATERHVDRPWYFPAAFALTVLDHFIFVLPIDGMMLTTVFLRPKRWLRTAIWFTVAVGLGAFMLAFFLQSAGDTVLPWLEARGLDLSTWHKTENWIQDYGFWGLALCAAAPMPVQPAVLIAALGHMSSIEVLASVLSGRIVKYVVMCYLASHAPHLLKRFTGVNREVDEIKRSDL